MKNLINYFKQNLSRKKIFKTAALSISLFAYYKRESIVNRISGFFGTYIKPYELQSPDFGKLFSENLNLPIEVL